MSEATRDTGERQPVLHKPVLLREVIDYLALQPGSIVVDGTVGAGGHSRKILEQIGPKGKLIGLDRDPMMLRLASRVLSGSNCHLHQSSYVKLFDVLEALGLQTVDAILLDLGLSSDQLADQDRGFSFESSGPLDLRFDTMQGEPAWRLIERLSEVELTEVFRRYGEEKFSKQLARHLATHCRSRPVRTAGDLAEAVAESIPRKFQREARKHPATRFFQALRIAVNDELVQLKTMLDDILYESLAVGGRAVIIAYHSLEDRLVKETFRDERRWQNLTRKPITASAVEKRMNPRSRAAKLRAAMKK